MDWPSRSAWRRIAWRWMRLAAWPRRRAQPRTEASGSVERLHTLDRSGDRLPLYVITVIDRDGHLVDVAACDPEEYAEYR